MLAYSSGKQQEELPQYYCSAIIIGCFCAYLRLRLTSCLNPETVKRLKKLFSGIGLPDRYGRPIYLYSSFFICQNMFKKNISLPLFSFWAYQVVYKQVTQKQTFKQRQVPYISILYIFRNNTIQIREKSASDYLSAWKIALWQWSQ